jgi:adenosylmethionine-8-amino-7-oxononanoate aminotransferase
MHGQTYNAHPVGCAAGLAVQTLIRDAHMLSRVREGGEHLRDLLNQRFGNHPNIGDIRGRGLLIALELVEDRSSKAPFDSTLAMHQRAKSEAFERGLLIYPSGGTVDGRSGDHILLAPPYTASDDELEMIVDLLADTLDALLPA